MRFSNIIFVIYTCFCSYSSYAYKENNSTSGWSRSSESSLSSYSYASSVGPYFSSVSGVSPCFSYDASSISPYSSYDASSISPYSSYDASSISPYSSYDASSISSSLTSTSFDSYVTTDSYATVKQTSLDKSQIESDLEELSDSESRRFVWSHNQEEVFCTNCYDSVDRDSLRFSCKHVYCKICLNFIKINLESGESIMCLEEGCRNDALLDPTLGYYKESSAQEHQDAKPKKKRMRKFFKKLFQCFIR